MASTNGHFDVVSCLVQNGADVNAPANDNSTPLFMAAEIGHFDVVRCLVENGADVNAPTNGNVTPLMKACSRKHVNVVTFLAEHEALLYLQDELGRTALHYALLLSGQPPLRDKQIEILSCLIKNGANVNVGAGGLNSLSTPLMLAVYSACHVDVVTFLLEHGAIADLQHKQGQIALHYAVDSLCKNQGQLKSQILLTHGASQLYDNQRLTPLLSASNLGETTVVEDFLGTPGCTKEQRIDALELLGASFATPYFRIPDPVRAFEYMKRGIEERFQDPSHPVLKQPREPVEAYQNRKEC